MSPCVIQWNLYTIILSSTERLPSFGGDILPLYRLADWKVSGVLYSKCPLSEVPFIIGKSFIGRPDWIYMYTETSSSSPLIVLKYGRYWSWSRG